MEILIYGAGNRGKLALKLIKNEYNIKCNIIGFIDINKCGKYLEYPIFKINEIGEFRGRIVIALNEFEIAKNVCKLLKENGYYDIFWFQNQRTILMHENFFIEQCYDCRNWAESMLLQVEMHIMDSCNLNCKGCAHFSPIFPYKLPDLQSRLRDVKKINEKIPYIMKFYILGGEPFLNPEIDKYICGIRDIMPYSQLYIVTNGLLIEKLSDEILQCIKDNQIWISISEYQPTHKKINNICQILNKYKILYELRELPNKNNFYMLLSLSENSKYPKKCLSGTCINIWNGKIARCPQLMYISYFNSYFNTNLPEEGVMSLEDCVSGKELIDILNKEVPLCKHCIQHEIEWNTCGTNVKLEDFVVFD